MNKQNVKFRRLWLTDILGFLKSFFITFEELEAGLELGSGFDGSFIQGFAHIDESDMVALPSPNAFQMFPWRATKGASNSQDLLRHLLAGGKLFEGEPDIC